MTTSERTFFKHEFGTDSSRILSTEQKEKNAGIFFGRNKTDIKHFVDVSSN